MGCGTVTSTGSGNAAPLVVDGFPCAAGGGANQINRPNTAYVSVQICAPGSTTNCQIIDHIIVDTGSPGLRIAAGALQSSLQPSTGALPILAGAASGTAVTECITYVSSYSYGPIVNADVYIAGEKVSNSSLQVYGSANYAAPTDCSSQGGVETDTPAAVGGNGVFGVNFETNDAYSLYFNCPPGNADACTLDSTYAGIPNVVSQFSTDNNGVTLSLPAVAATGSTTPVVGTLYFGVGTQANNMPSATTWSLPVDPNIADASGSLNPGYLTFAATLSGTWTTAYLDSGTDVDYFTDAALALCTSSPTNPYYGYFCPSTTQSVTFELAGTGTTSPAHALSYSVVSPTSLGYGATAVAVADVAGATGASSTLTNTTFAFGLASFFGHTVYVLFSGKTAPGTAIGGTGPIDGYD